MEKQENNILGGIWSAAIEGTRFVLEDGEDEKSWPVITTKCIHVDEYEKTQAQINALQKVLDVCKKRLEDEAETIKKLKLEIAEMLLRCNEKLE